MLHLYWQIPNDFKDVIRSWEHIHKSPHSYSYYDTHNKNWGVNPIGHLRISDHWNVLKHGRIHSPTDRHVDNFKNYALKEYEIYQFLPVCNLWEIREEDLYLLKPHQQEIRAKIIKQRSKMRSN